MTAMDAKGENSLKSHCARRGTLRSRSTWPFASLRDLFFRKLLVPSVGYTGVFVGSLVCSLFGVILLMRVEDPRRSHLALSSE